MMTQDTETHECPHCEQPEDACDCDHCDHCMEHENDCACIYCDYCMEHENDCACDKTPEISATVAAPAGAVLIMVTMDDAKHENMCPYCEEDLDECECEMCAKCGVHWLDCECPICPDCSERPNHCTCCRQIPEPGTIPADSTQMARLVQEYLTGRMPDYEDIQAVETFEEAGACTMDAGVRVVWSDGSSYELTIVRR